MVEEFMNMELIGELAFLWGVILLGSLYSYIKAAGKDREISERCTGRTIGIRDYFCKGTLFKGMQRHRGAGNSWSYGLTYEYIRYMSYRYRVDGEEYSGIDSRIPFAWKKSGEEGTEAEIFYDPSRPQDFYCPSEDGNARWAGVIAEVGGGVVVTVLLILISMQK